MCSKGTRVNMILSLGADFTPSWISPIIASALFGLGIYIIILGILNYVVDSYQTYSASALAGVIFVRNLVGGGFPMVSCLEAIEVVRFADCLHSLQRTCTKGLVWNGPALYLPS
jgi:hypothetical protein